MEGYEIVKELTSFRDVVNHFKEASEPSYLLLSTEGWHGSNWTLNDCERILKDEDEVWTTKGAYITVFIVCPQSVTLRWGNVRLKTQQEIDWLRKRQAESLELINRSQEGNV